VTAARAKKKKRAGRRRPRRRLTAISVLPTLCTLANLVAGFAALHYASKDPTVRMLGDWTPLSFAAALVFLGMFLDAVDGSIARLTRSDSDLGSQLDSLADVVTFGVAPAYMTLRLVINHLEGDGWIIGPGADNVLGKVIWGAAALFVCCAALRLARFNVEHDLEPVNEDDTFRGLPSPGAAGAVVSLIALHQDLLVERFAADVPKAFVQGTALGLPVVMLLCGFAMVSSIPYVHFTNRYIRGPRSFGYISRLVVLLALAIWWFQWTLALVFTAYVLSGPIAFLRARRAARGIGAGAAVDTDDTRAG
jgi:CDP-diacylglycerol--serine O-phosphatidyltransferase